MHGWMRKDFPIWRDAEQLLVDIECAVRRFPRYHKYTLGSELRLLAARVLSCVTHAINHKEARSLWVERLATAIEELKLRLQLGKSLQVFASFTEFERLAKTAVDVSRQSTRWRQKLQRPGLQAAP